MQNGQYETFAEHFKNGTVTHYKSNIERNEPIDFFKGFPVDVGNNKVTFEFDMITYHYSGSFTITDNSELACILKATEIINKLMN